MFILLLLCFVGRQQRVLGLCMCYWMGGQGYLQDLGFCFTTISPFSEGSCHSRVPLKERSGFTPDKSSHHKDV